MNKFNSDVTNYFYKFSEKTSRLEEIRRLIHLEIPDVEEKIWSGVPCFYTEGKHILIRAFDDHINFITDNVFDYKETLLDYKITPKGMLQIYDEQKLPLAELSKILSTCGIRK